MDQKQIGNFLASLRKEKHLTQEALAEELGITNKTVSRWETGTYLPDADMLLALSCKYKVSINEILSGTRLDEEQFRKHADANIERIVVEGKRKQVRLTSLFAMILAIVLVLNFAIFVGIFLYKRNKELYCGLKQNEKENDKEYCGQIELTLGNMSGAEQIGSDVKINAVIPSGYVVNNVSNDFVTATKGSSKIICRMNFDIVLPLTTSIINVFAQIGANSFCEKVRYAYQYDLSAVSVLSNEADISVAGGVRMIKQYVGLPNRTDNKGSFWYVTRSNVKGYIVSDAPDGNLPTYCACLEQNGKIFFFTFVDQEGGWTNTKVVDFLSCVEFV